MPDLHSLDEYVLRRGLYQSSTVTVVDSAGNLVFGQVHYDSLDQVTLTFSGGFSGTASLI